MDILRRHNSSDADNFGKDDDCQGEFDSTTFWVVGWIIFYLVLIVCIYACCPKCRLLNTSPDTAADDQSHVPSVNGDGESGRGSIFVNDRFRRTIFVISVNDNQPPALTSDDPPKYEFEVLPPTYEELYHKTQNQTEPRAAVS